MNDIKDAKTPYFTISKSKVLKQYKILEDLGDIISYSSKTNPVVTGILEENTSTMFSVHTINELKNIKDTSRVLFIAQAWNENILKDLVFKRNISWFVVDNEVDLETFIEFVRKNEFKQKLTLLFRLKLKEFSIRTEKYYVFGMGSDFISKKVNEIFNDLNLMNKIAKLGLHFHRKSQNLSEWNLQYELEEVFNQDFFDKISVVNIGGGLPSMYANVNVNVFQGIYNKIKDFRGFLNSNKIDLMMEPGRFVSAPAGKFVTTIIGIHGNTIIVDGSVYNGDLDALIVPVKLLVKGELSQKDRLKEGTRNGNISGQSGTCSDSVKTYVVKGVTPCSMDIFRYRVYMKEKKVGDELVFEYAGAYNFASDFCDLDKNKTYIIE